MLKFKCCSTCADDSTKLIEVGGMDFCARCARAALDAVCPQPMRPTVMYKPTEDDVLTAMRAGYKTLPGIRTKIGARHAWLEFTLVQLRRAGRVQRDRNGAWRLAEQTAQHAV